MICIEKETYPALGELSGALVLAVAQQFDDTALVWGKTGDLTDDVADKGGALAEVTLHARDAGRWLAGSDLLYENFRQHDRTN